MSLCGTHTHTHTRATLVSLGDAHAQGSRQGRQDRQGSQSSLTLATLATALSVSPRDAKVAGVARAVFDVNVIETYSLIGLHD